MKETPGELRRKADSDLRGAQLLRAESIEQHADKICADCQQAAGKYLKASLMMHGVQITKTHDLGSLWRQLVALDDNWAPLQLDCEILSGHLSLRYAGRADAEEAAQAIVKAERIAAVAIQWLDSQS